MAADVHYIVCCWVFSEGHLVRRCVSNYCVLAVCRSMAADVHYVVCCWVFSAGPLVRCYVSYEFIVVVMFRFEGE